MRVVTSEMHISERRCFAMLLFKANGGLRNRKDQILVSKQNMDSIFQVGDWAVLSGSLRDFEIVVVTHGPDKCLYMIPSAFV